MGSHDVDQVIAQLMLAVASFALGAVLVALHMTPLEPLPTVTQVHVVPAQVAGLGWPAARPKLMVDKCEILRPLQPEAFDDELAFLGTVRVDAALRVRLWQGVEEIAVEEVLRQGASPPGVLKHGAQGSADKAVDALSLIRVPVWLALGAQGPLESHKVMCAERRE